MLTKVERLCTLPFRFDTTKGDMKLLHLTLEDDRCQSALNDLIVEHDLTREAEDWRFVMTPEFESTEYLVSSCGRVLSLPRYRYYEPNGRSGVAHKKYQPGGLMSPGRQPSGHRTITISHQKKLFRTHVHRLVAWTFLGPQPDGLYVRHLDNDPSNNHIDNLIYGTPYHNLMDRKGAAVTAADEVAIIISAKLQLRIERAVRAETNPIPVLNTLLKKIKAAKAHER